VHNSSVLRQFRQFPACRKTSLLVNREIRFALTNFGNQQHARSMPTDLSRNPSQRDGSSRADHLTRNSSWPINRRRKSLFSNDKRASGLSNCSSSCPALPSSRFPNYTQARVDRRSQIHANRFEIKGCRRWRRRKGHHDIEKVEKP
jgi:hypothetical protein